jgi:hypothetical protein
MSQHKPYIAAYSDGEGGKYYVSGDGFSYYQGTLAPRKNTDDEFAAEYAAQIANIAWAEGYNAAQRDMQKALGLEDK